MMVVEVAEMVTAVGQCGQAATQSEHEPDSDRPAKFRERCVHGNSFGPVRKCGPFATPRLVFGGEPVYRPEGHFVTDHFKSGGAIQLLAKPGAVRNFTAPPAVYLKVRIAAGEPLDG
jgi:hypothetical protein